MARRVVDGQISLFEGLRRDGGGDLIRPAASGGPPSPKGEGLGTPRATLKPLTLEQVRGLEPFKSHVWIENRDFGKGGFLELFYADVSLLGRSLCTGRDVFHFSYTFTDGRRYDHCRVDEFYGREWRVWPDRPTDKEREDAPWDE